MFLLLCRYTSVNEVVIKPNPKGASSPQVQKEAEAEKVSSGTSVGTQHEYSCSSKWPLRPASALPCRAYSYTLHLPSVSVCARTQVLKAIASGERVVILDERGRDTSSEDMARLLIKASDDGTPLCFVIGGPFGHGTAVMQRADESVRLSRMVLNHSVAYLVLVEQLYRAWTIVRGEPYHH